MDRKLLQSNLILLGFKKIHYLLTIKYIKRYNEDYMHVYININGCKLMYTDKKAKYPKIYTPYQSPSNLLLAINKLLSNEKAKYRP